MKPLNIVYINSHDTGRYIQPYGYDVSTPRLQDFAEQGVLFRHAHTNNPTCSPSRACLQTGQYAHTNGMLGLAHRGGTLNEPSHTLANHLKGQGYQTGLAGFQHIQGRKHSSADIGYENTYGKAKEAWLKDGGGEGKTIPQDYATVWAAEQFIRDRDPDQPFFLDVGFITTHRTGKKNSDVQWHNAEDSPVGDPRYVRGPSCLPDTPEVRKDFADYQVAVKRLDDLMGSVIQAIDDAGLVDSTLILVTTDHGIAYPHMKCNLTDHGTGVMVMLRGPKGSLATGGAVIDAQVQQIDLFPTLCELAGANAADWVQGKSWVPLLDGSKEKLHEAIFMEVNNHAAYEPKRSVRTARYRYTKRFDALDGPVLANCDDSISKTQWYEAGAVEHGVEEEVLYDLMLDPNEADNRIDDPALAEVAQQMRDRLDTWMRETDDPMLGEPKNIMEGFVVNQPESYSPTDKPTAAKA